MSSSNSENQHRSKPISDTRARIMLYTVLGVLLLFAIFVLSLPWLDSHDRQWVSCDVHEAKATRGSNNSSHPWFVKIETEQCGTIFYTETVDRERVEGIAASFEPEEYEFLMGWVSRLNVDAYVPFFETSAVEYRRVAP